MFNAPPSPGDNAPVPPASGHVVGPSAPSAPSAAPPVASRETNCTLVSVLSEVTEDPQDGRVVPAEACAKRPTVQYVCRLTPKNAVAYCSWKIQVGVSWCL